MRGAMTIEKVMESVIRSIVLRSLLFGNRAAHSVYPGKKRRNGSPKAMRSAAMSAREMIVIRTNEQRFMIRSSF